MTGGNMRQTFFQRNTDDRRESAFTRNYSAILAHEQHKHTLVSKQQEFYAELNEHRAAAVEVTTRLQSAIEEKKAMILQSGIGGRSPEAMLEHIEKTRGSIQELEKAASFYKIGYYSEMENKAKAISRSLAIAAQQTLSQCFDHELIAKIPDTVATEQRCHLLQKELDMAQRAIKDNTDMQAQLDQAVCALRDLESTSSREMEALRTQIGAQNTRFKTLQTNHKALQAEKDAIRDDHDQLQSDHDTLRRDYDTLNNNYKTLHDRKEALRTANKELRDRVDDLATQVSEATERLEETVLRASEAEGQLCQATTSSDVLQMKYSSTQSQLATIEKSHAMGDLTKTIPDHGKTTKEALLSHMDSLSQALELQLRTAMSGLATIVSEQNNISKKALLERMDALSLSLGSQLHAIVERGDAAQEEGDASTAPLNKRRRVETTSSRQPMSSTSSSEKTGSENGMLPARPSTQNGQLQFVHRGKIIPFEDVPSSVVEEVRAFIQAHGHKLVSNPMYCFTQDVLARPSDTSLRPIISYKFACDACIWERRVCLRQVQSGFLALSANTIRAKWKG